MMGTDAFVSCGKTCEHAVAFDGMFASRSPGRAETCEQTLRARRLKTPGARRSVCKSSLFRLSRNNPFSQSWRGLKRIVPIIPPAWGAAILAAVGRAVLGEPRGEGRAPARPLTGKAAFQAAGWRGLWPRRTEGCALVAPHTVERAVSRSIPCPSR